MPNITSVLNEQIRRLAKREIKANTKVVRRATVKYRHAIATLKRQVADLTRRLTLAEKQQPKAITAAPEVPDNARFRAIGVKAHRAKLGLSAKDYGKLVGVSKVTIFKWETGRSQPRAAQKAMWLAIRGLRKHEAMERLGMAGPKAASAPAVKPAAKPAKPDPRQISKGQRPAKAQEFILSLLEQGKPLLTAQINTAWKTAKRAGRANKTLGLMVQGKKLKRIKVAGERGSAYTLTSVRLPVIVAAQPTAKPAPRKTGQRGQFEQTAEEMILSLLQGRKALTTRELAVAWKKAGRGGAVDNPLGRLVKAKKLKRTPLAGQRGSAYSLR